MTAQPRSGIPLGLPLGALLSVRARRSGKEQHLRSEAASPHPSSSSRADEEEKRRRWHRACISTHTGVEGERSFAALRALDPQKRNAKNHCLSLSLFPQSSPPTPARERARSEGGDKRKKESKERRGKKKSEEADIINITLRRLSTPHHHHRVRAKRPREQHDNTEQGFEEDDGR